METNDDQFTEFSLGQIVYLKSNPSTPGAVVEIVPGTPEDSIKVLINNRVQTFFASQLQLELDSEEESQRLSCDEFHAYLTALQIQSPALSTLYSLNSARIDFIPYQYRPVLKFIKSDRPRLLIADSVGVGKTIEAGLILRELQARGDIRSVLIICPRPLVAEEKWYREMKRFDEEFEHLSGDTLRYCIRETHLDGEWPERHQKAILPYSLLTDTLLYGPDGSTKRRTGQGLIELDPPPHFDLVIVDEAHHIRNQNTANHKAVEFFCDHSEAAIFLTATPIQLSDKDLYVLLNVLRPDLILDQDSFEHMSEPNPHINQAVEIARTQHKGWIKNAVRSLDLASETAWGRAILKRNPKFNRIRSHLSTGQVNHDERIQLITDMEMLHTFSGIINRTRRRDIGEFTIRRPQTIEVAMPTEQEELHEVLLETQAEIYRTLHGDKSVNFMMTTLRRQLASCFFGLEPLLKDIMTRHLDELEWTEADAADALPTPENITLIEKEISMLLEKVRNLDTEDLKLKALLKIVRERQNLPNNKIMIFSSFRHTLAYLYKYLKDQQIRVGMIHGGVPDEERRELSLRFEKNKSEDDCIDLMLFSEVGCEGLDYQFCDCILNYDLPWNPMKIEQRIGRIDRRGQKSESVTIYNLITPDTVDADIYERCLSRIGVFESALGGSEEILGKITKELQIIAEDYGLTQEERINKLKQLEDNEIRYMLEQESIEAQQLDLFSVPLSEHKMKQEVEDASSFWLSPASIQRLVTRYLQQKIGTEQEFILGEKSPKTLRLSEDARNTLLQDYRKSQSGKTKVNREWENWLKGSEQHLTITFEPESATRDPKAVFIMPIHPLVKQASTELNLKQKVITNLKVQTDKIPAGRYEFAIYMWEFLGIKDDLILKPIASSDELMQHLSDLLENAGDNEIAEDVSLSEQDTLERLHQQLWAESREKHRDQIRGVIEYRKETLTASHNKRINLLENKSAQVSDPKIQRMRRQQIENTKTDYNRRMRKFDEDLEKVDLTAELVAYGVLNVEMGV